MHAIEEPLEHGWRLHVPRVGENVDEAAVDEIVAVIGAELRAGEDLIVLETDKVNVTITTPTAGRVVVMHVRPGDTVRPRDAICDLAVGATS